MNIKPLLIEKERVAYIENKPELAGIFAACLQHIINLEERINQKDAEIDAVEAWQKEGETLFGPHTNAGMLFNLGQWWGERPWR